MVKEGNDMCLDDHRPLKRSELAQHANAMLERLRADGVECRPVVAAGRNLATSFWAREWMKRLVDSERYGMRLAPGRTYLRYGCVLDLSMEPGHIRALVAGENLYEVHIAVSTPDDEQIECIRQQCGGSISSWVDLLKGNLGDDVLRILCEDGTGILPAPDNMSYSCTCPDWADLCKHSAAALYAAGVMLDTRPELLFLLRNIKLEQLIPGEPEVDAPKTLAGSSLSSLFGINVED